VLGGVYCGKCLLESWFEFLLIPRASYPRYLHGDVQSMVYEYDFGDHHVIIASMPDSEECMGCVRIIKERKNNRKKRLYRALFGSQIFEPGEVHCVQCIELNEELSIERCIASGYVEEINDPSVECMNCAESEGIRNEQNAAYNSGVKI